MQKSAEDAEDLAEFYNYLEVQPPENYAHLVEKELVQHEGQIIDIIQKMVAMADRLGKRVVATGNAHYIETYEKQFREILIASQKGNPLNRVTLPSTPFRTTEEMLNQFQFLGDEKAKEIVIENSNAIASEIEAISPVKDGLFTPSIEGAEDEVRQLTYGHAEKIYSSLLPEIFEFRLNIELYSIIRHGFAVIYLISHKLVKKSLIDGYLVGSRESVGSSLVATMTEITEVNPLPPHYVCKNCQYHSFYIDGTYGSGFDLLEKACPNCDESIEN